MAKEITEQLEDLRVAFKHAFNTAVSVTKHLHFNVNDPFPITLKKITSFSDLTQEDYIAALPGMVNANYLNLLSLSGADKEVDTVILQQYLDDIETIQQRAQEEIFSEELRTQSKGTTPENIISKLAELFDDIAKNIEESGQEIPKLIGRIKTDEQTVLAELATHYNVIHKGSTYIIDALWSYKKKMVPN